MQALYKYKVQNINLTYSIGRMVLLFLSDTISELKMLLVINIFVLNKAPVPIIYKIYLTSHNILN